MIASRTITVIPGHRAAMSPERMTTIGAREAVAAARRPMSEQVFMGSGLAPAARPGMTEVVTHLVEAETCP